MHNCNHTADDSIESLTKPKLLCCKRKKTHKTITPNSINRQFRFKKKNKTKSSLNSFTLSIILYFYFPQINFPSPNFTYKFASHNRFVVTMHSSSTVQHKKWVQWQPTHYSVCFYQHLANALPPPSPSITTTTVNRLTFSICVHFIVFSVSNVWVVDSDWDLASVHRHKHCRLRLDFSFLWIA